MRRSTWDSPSPIPRLRCNTLVLEGANVFQGTSELLCAQGNGCWHAIISSAATAYITAVSCCQVHSANPCRDTMQYAAVLTLQARMAAASRGACQAKLIMQLCPRPQTDAPCQQLAVVDQVRSASQQRLAKTRLCSWQLGRSSAYCQKLQQMQQTARVLWGVRQGLADSYQQANINLKLS